MSVEKSHIKQNVEEYFLYPYITINVRRSQVRADFERFSDVVARQD